MAGVLRAEPLWVETFTGLWMSRFEKLVRVVRERGGNGPASGRPWCLPLADRVLVVAVCRVIQRLRPLLAIEPAPRPVADVERLWIVRVEHTLARTKTWKILRDCRQKGDGLHHAVQAVATMHNLAVAG
ncbi:hypothetical protein [Streptomyces arboris]|uniref:Transposase n=1 Tax=Streptomyces arboris TaxID=2600619 RepID=A0A5N5EJJ2_9ACTN|nr:hypothetical protein [Streptomyces arboris]KAB2590433.1 hypothetical protein F5983_21885 [Streptomyces arboris]